ncbi:hypothetical protein FACS189452_05080 [Bacteroidia bacterium]|nr:hypothetical protein FACS189452_05080 [Bacteroidia bacterium]GHT80899.1 hypothetical protein FACS189467_4020 [Bacteroidia bacterium]
MKQNPKSEGKCLYCGKMFAKAGINRHLKTHLDEKVKTGKFGVSYFVKVEVQKWAPKEHFLSLWVDDGKDYKTTKKIVNNYENIESK